MQEKRCSKCAEVKPLDEFDRTKKSQDGRASHCKACRRTIRRAAYKPHPQSRITLEPGQRFGHLTVVNETAARNNSRRIICTCDCGTVKELLLQTLLKGQANSCGCLHREQLAERNRSAEQRAYITTHGVSKHPLYRTWTGMIRRCENQEHHAFRNYGGRGIKVCPEWHDPAAFITWIEANLGPRPDGTTLDRWPDNDGNYEPGNIRWATRSEQRRNRRLA